MGSAAKPVLCIVTPGTRDANNGNWRTAARWSQMLRDRYTVIVQSEWRGERAAAMVALHARRSAASIAAFHEARLGPIALVLTGTDIYGDLPGNPQALRSVELADRLVVLQEQALEAVPDGYRERTTVLLQSAPSLARRAKAKDHLDCVAVGHLRAVKDPLTLIRAWALLPRDAAIFMRHIGAPLDAALAKEVRAYAKRDPRYRYAGALSHGLARAAIARAHFLVHPSSAEGGANVIVEAVTAGTPVLASRIPGNVGMLGGAYPGYFEAGDAKGLAALLEHALAGRRFVRSLAAACARRRPLFAPAREKRGIRGLVEELVSGAA